MIQCNGCGFGVSESMRFALMKNICPSCGSGLFSNKDSSVISMIQSRLKSERFSSSLTENQIYDLSLFFFNEIKTGFVKQVFSDYNSKKISSDDDSEVSHSEEGEADDIRKEIEKEYSTQINNLLDEDGDIQTEDVESKASRLKKLYQNTVNSNPSLVSDNPIKTTRRGGFKGVSRST